MSQVGLPETFVVEKTQATLLHRGLWVALCCGWERNLTGREESSNLSVCWAVKHRPREVVDAKALHERGILCYGAEPPHGGCGWLLWWGCAGRWARFTHSYAKGPPGKEDSVTSGGQAQNTARRDHMRRALGTQSNQKPSGKSIRTGRSCPARQHTEGKTCKEAEECTNH